MALTTFESMQEEKAMEHRVIDLRRVTRVMKGGRRFRFRATVLIGDKRGSVGLGIAKGADVQRSVEKAQNAAKKNLINVTIVKGTIPHSIQRRFRGATILLNPAPEGSGIIAGGPVRSIALLAGILNLSSKMMGSHNPVNVTRATLLALSQLKPARVIKAALRPSEDSHASL